jgi:hypothetical protein
MAPSYQLVGLKKPVETIISKVIISTGNPPVK